MELAKAEAAAVTPVASVAFAKDVLAVSVLDAVFDGCRAGVSNRGDGDE